MPNAYTTIPCTFFQIRDGRVNEKAGWALPELVYADPERAAAVLLSGRPVYVELSAEELIIFRGLIANRTGELRFK